VLAAALPDREENLVLDLGLDKVDVHVNVSDVLHELSTGTRHFN